jgi:hypothetical protein
MTPYPHPNTAGPRRPWAFRSVGWTVLVASAALALLGAGVLISVAARSADQWRATVDRLDERLAAAMMCATPGAWSSIDKEIEDLVARTKLSNGGPQYGSYIRANHSAGITESTTPPESSTPRDRAWWGGLMNSAREKTYPLDLGPGYKNVVLKVRQQRHWLACQFEATLVTTTPLDCVRATALGRVLAETGLQLGSSIHRIR